MHLLHTQKLRIIIPVTVMQTNFDCIGICTEVLHSLNIDEEEFNDRYVNINVVYTKGVNHHFHHVTNLYGFFGQQCDNVKKKSALIRFN